MVVSPRATPEEFGEALTGVRAAAGVALEHIAERTKISMRMLTALEAGDFGKLPDRVFARLFLRQYLGIVGAAPDDWVAALEAAWRRFEDASHPALPIQTVPVRRAPLAPWAIGLALVAIGVAAVLLVVERPRGGRATPAVAVAASSTAPVPTPVPPATPAAAVGREQPDTPEPSGQLVVRTDELPCWVEVRVAGEEPASRLLGARSTWTIDAAGRDVDLVLGNAGAATVEYLGRVRAPAGAPGAVARLHLDGAGVKHR